MGRGDNRHTPKSRRRKRQRKLKVRFARRAAETKASRQKPAAAASSKSGRTKH